MGWSFICNSESQTHVGMRVRLVAIKLAFLPFNIPPIIWLKCR